MPHKYPVIYTGPDSATPSSILVLRESMMQTAEVLSIDVHCERIYHEVELIIADEAIADSLLTTTATVFANMVMGLAFLSAFR
ncbi:hypothetical protein Plhal304r1_c075g0162811 [Plasmopara halstedii]